MIKVFNMDDCTWIAAANVDDAWRGLAEFMGGSSVEGVRADYAGYTPEELTEADLDRLIFCACDDGDECMDDDHETAHLMAFRERLAQMKAEGKTFPCFFATTEY